MASTIDCVLNNLLGDAFHTAEPGPFFRRFGHALTSLTVTDRHFQEIPRRGDQNPVVFDGTSSDISNRIRWLGELASLVSFA